MSKKKKKNQMSSSSFFLHCNYLFKWCRKLTSKLKTTYWASSDKNKSYVENVTWDTTSSYFEVQQEVEVELIIA